jgi:hypothetical protein
MPQEELDLLEFAARQVAQPRARSAQIVLTLPSATASFAVADSLTPCLLLRRLSRLRVASAVAIHFAR